MVVAWITNSGLMLRFVLPTIRENLTGRTMRLPLSVAGIPALINLCVQILNATGWLWEPGFLGYLLGLFVYLYAAGLMFVYMVVYRPRGTPEP